MADFHTGKQKAQRIDLAYHRRTDSFRSWRSYLTIMAVAGAVGYAAFGLFAGPAGEFQFTHGPVSAPHAHIDRNCGACHEPFKPIRNDSFLAKWPGVAKAIFGTPAAKEGEVAAESWGRVSDAKCMVCHKQTLGHHDHLSKPEDITSCASCHVEHRGRNAHISLATDPSCLRCHDKLDEHRQPLSAELPSAAGAGAEPIAAHVGRFYDDHPEFRSLKSDPGTLWTFSHAQHLGKGISKTGSTVPPMKWKEVANLGDIRKPAGVSDDDVVQLNCQSCHLPDAGLATRAGGRSPKAGEFMAPVTFARHCAGCHERDLPQGVSHGITAGEVVSQLKLSLAEELAQGKLKTSEKKPVGPGMGVGPLLRELGQIDTSSEVFKSRQQDAQNKCAKCHQYEPATGGALPEIQPPGIPSAWLAHGRFNHAAHTTVKCDDCHSGAARSQSGKDVSIENKGSCVNCHRPENSGVPGSGARHECGLCHVFHVGPSNYGTAPAKGKDPVALRDAAGPAAGVGPEHRAAVRGLLAGK